MNDVELGSSALIPLVGTLVQSVVSSVRAARRVSSAKTLVLVYALAMLITGLAHVGLWYAAPGQPIAVFASNAALTAVGAAVWAIGQDGLSKRDKKAPERARRDDPPPDRREGGRIPFDDPEPPRRPAPPGDVGRG